MQQKKGIRLVNHKQRIRAVLAGQVGLQVASRIEG